MTTRPIEKFHFWYSILTRDSNVYRDYKTGSIHKEYEFRKGDLSREIYCKIRNEDKDIETYFAILFDMIYPANGDSRFNYARHSAWYKRISQLNELYKTDVVKCFKNRFFVCIQSLYYRKPLTWIPKPTFSARGGTFFFGTVHKLINLHDLNIGMIPNICFIEVIQSLQEVDHTHFLIGMTYPKNVTSLEYILGNSLQCSVSVEIVYTSYTRCHAYTHSQMITQTSTIMVASGWETFTTYYSYIHPLFGLKCGNYISKAYQHDLPYNHEISMEVYNLNTNHPDRWKNRYSINVLRGDDNSEVKSILKDLVVGFFNSDLDVYYVNNIRTSGVIPLDGYRLQPIISVSPPEGLDCHFDWSGISPGDIPPLIVVGHKNFVNDSLEISVYHKNVYDIDSLRFQPIDLYDYNIDG